MSTFEARPSIAFQVKRLRTDRQITQEALAAAAGVHRVTVARIEAGVEQPGAKILFALADALGVPADDLRTSPPVRK